MKPSPWAVVMAVVAWLAAVGWGTTPARADIDPAKVQQSIDAGVAYLRNDQDKTTGAWRDYVNNPTGVTSLCTLALLSCGHDSSDPTVQRALAHLRRNSPELLNALKPMPNLTYAVSLQAMVFAAADPQADLPRIQKCVDWLETAQIKNGPNEGCWTYRISEVGGDNSNAQFALLALHEAERVGARVKEETWRRALAYWRRAQDPSGSWSYMNPQGSRAPGMGTMTCAGITSVIIASGKLSSLDAQVQGDTVLCCGQPPPVAGDPAQRGFDWLAKSFVISHNPVSGQRLQRERGRTYHMYYLYGIERVGRLTGQRWIGKHDWYRAGVELLVGTNENRGPQDLDGSWVGQGHAEDSKTISTAMALLFLSKGRRPVLIAKLQHGQGNDWNRHRHDLEHLTRYVETRWKKVTKRELTWQVVAAQHATLDDLRQSPVLWISGHEGLNLTPDQEKVLRAYVDQGGFILAENCCESGKFEEDFKAFLARTFPDGSLMPIDDPAHPIWGAEELLDPKLIARHPLLGLSTGCRIAVLYTPKNLGCYWELGRTMRGAKPGVYSTSPVANKEIEFCLGMGINILAYATNRQVKYKHEIPATKDKPLASDVQRGKIFVAKLKHDGGCDEAPAALGNALAAAGRELKLAISTERRLIPITDPRLFDYHVVFIHGRRDFRLSDGERGALKTFLQRGGMVVGDAINSQPEFAQALRRELKAMFPDQQLERIPPTDPLITPPADNLYGSYDIRQVTLREPIAAGKNEPRAVKESRVPPLLEGLKIDDRYAVIFSPYDLSCALENYESLQFPGYNREDALKIVLNMLLYSLQR